MAIGKMWTAALAKFKAELSKCQLLCITCHKIKSRESNDNPGFKNIFYGEETSRHKLTWEDVAYIRKSTESGPTLARLFGVHRSTIQGIRRGKYWNEELRPVGVARG